MLSAWGSKAPDHCEYLTSSLFLYNLCIQHTHTAGTHRARCFRRRPRHRDIPHPFLHHFVHCLDCWRVSGESSLSSSSSSTSSTPACSEDLGAELVEAVFRRRSSAADFRASSLARLASFRFFAALKTIQKGQWPQLYRRCNGKY